MVPSLRLCRIPALCGNRAFVPALQHACPCDNRARREAYRQTRAIMQARTGVDTHSPLPARLLAFAKLHPAVVAALAGVAVLAGPRRLIRLTGMLMPLLSRLRR